uniref:(northern house mosquito) hypothetical protein n=1 Tax=Culex pipiens TaxID=7175 RepID=A0A8D8GWK5_CULPI
MLLFDRLGDLVDRWLKWKRTLKIKGIREDPSISPRSSFIPFFLLTSVHSLSANPFPMQHLRLECVNKRLATVCRYSVCLILLPDLALILICLCCIIYYFNIHN